MNTEKEASVADVLLTVGATVGLLTSSVILFGSDSSSGANQIAPVIGAVIATVVAIKNGQSWKVIEETIVFRNIHFTAGHPDSFLHAPQEG